MVLYAPTPRYNVEKVFQTNLYIIPQLAPHVDQSASRLLIKATVLFHACLINIDTSTIL